MRFSGRGPGASNRCLPITSAAPAATANRTNTLRMALPTTTKGCRAVLERRVGISTVSGSSAVRGLRGVICLGVLEPIEVVPPAVTARWEIGGYGSPAPGTAFPAAVDDGTGLRADWPLALGCRATGAAAPVRCPVGEATGRALPVPSVGGGGPLLGVLSALAATGRDFGAAAVPGLETVAPVCELGACGPFGGGADVGVGAAGFKVAGAAGGTFAPFALGAGVTRGGTPVLSLPFGGGGESELSHRRISTSALSMISKRVGGAERVDARRFCSDHDAPTLNRRRVRSKYGGTVKRGTRCSPGETPARRWCRRTRMSSTARR